MTTIQKINPITSVEATTAALTSNNKNPTAKKKASNKSMIAIMLTWSKINKAWSQFHYRIAIKICSQLTNRNNSHIYRKRKVPVIEDRRIRAWRCQLLHNVFKTIIENIVSLLIEFHTSIKIDLQFRVYQSI